MRRNPDVMDEFEESLRGHLVKAFDDGDRVVMVNKRGFGTFVHFYNYPMFYARGRNAAEAENNRQMFSISPAKNGKVKLEHTVNMLAWDTRLRAKTGTPAAIGKYLAEHLNHVVRTVEPHFTHTKMNPRRHNPKHPLDRVRGHQLLPASVAKKIPKLYATEKVKDPTVHVKLFSPYSNAVWFITEYDPNDDLAFGYADLGMGGGELGYISIRELADANRRGLPLVERDLYWPARPLSQAKKER